MTQPAPRTAPRTGKSARSTSETKITCAINLDGTGATDIKTGLGFLDHMLTALAKHSGIDITLTCQGDLHVDDHHTAEDCALTLGEAIDRALGDRAGVIRYGSAYAPLDEALARAVVDLVTRPHCSADLRLVRESVGDMSTEMIPHVFESLATAGRFTLHVDVIKGANDHHRAEAAFKSLALALKQAVRVTGSGIPSTKGAM